MSAQFESKALTKMALNLKDGVAVNGTTKAESDAGSKEEEEAPKAKIRKSEKSWSVKASDLAKNTLNPIRKLVDQMKLTPNPDKKMIALSIGDPTVFGNMNPPAEAKEAVIAVVHGTQQHGYAPSVGYEASRQAVADLYNHPDAPLTAKDVILTNGCSGALDICISCLCTPGSTLLCPRPGFSLYKTLAVGLGVKVQYYDLLPDKSWEVDLAHLTSLLEAHEVSAMVVNNPSNPCGSNYSSEHLRQILSIAAQYKTAIIADEIYADFVFPGNKFVQMASLTKEVPILSCGGLTKRWIVPGWRMGWILIQDRNEIFAAEVRQGLVSLSQRILGPNTLVQAAIPDILDKVPSTFYSDTIGIVQRNAVTCYAALSSCPGLTPVMPCGAMYMMVKIDIEHFPEFASDVNFTEKMVTEQSVFCLPATVFEYPNYFRVVLTVPEEMMEEAVERIGEFVADHYKIPSAVAIE